MESLEISNFIKLMTGTVPENLFLVFAGFFWCFFGIILRKLYNSSQEGKTIIQFFKETSKKELILKSMLVIAAMRFFRVIFDTDEIAFAGFVIGLSLDILPQIIFSIPKVFTSRFNNIDSPPTIPETQNNQSIDIDVTVHSESNYGEDKKEGLPNDKNVQQSLD